MEKPEVGCQMSEDREQRSDRREQRSEGGTQMSEGGCRRAEDRDQNSVKPASLIQIPKEVGNYRRQRQGR